MDRNDAYIIGNAALMLRALVANARTDR